MKAMKRIGALALALCLVLALGVTALAADISTYNDANNAANVDSFTINVTLAKKDGVNSPANTVTFALAPASGAAIGGNTYHAGPANGIKFANTGDNTATFPVNASTAAELTQTITVTTDKAQFNAPGVYRYEITETVNKTDLGFAAHDATTKYIDVYVKSDGGTGFIVYAAMMGESYDATTKALDTKDSAFDITYSYSDIPGTPGDPTDDTEDSYDVTVSKVIAGAAADPDDVFTFELKVKGLADAAGVIVPVTKSAATMTGDATITLAADDATYTYTMKGGENFKLTGLPKTLALEVVESVAGIDGYTTTMTVSGMDGADTATARTAKGTVKADDGEITFTNTRDTISPTGVIMRVAPLVILLGASVVFFAMSRKRKENKA